MPDQAARIQAFLDKQECTELVYKFARGIDRLDIPLIRSIFHPDGTDDHGIFKGTIEEYLTWLEPMMAAMKATAHTISNVLIELEGDVAHGESYFFANHELVRDGETIHYTAAGRYLDRFERRNNEWKIAHRLAVYDWSEEGKSTDFLDRAGTGPGTRARGRRDRQDPSYRP